MKKSDLFAMAWENLRNRKTRTRLTIAGVVVGTCAIIIMVSIGVGIDKMITSQYQSDSTLNKITVYPMGDYTNDSGEVQKEMPFDDSAVNYFSKLNNVKTVVPTLEVSSYINISHGKYTYNSSVYGIPLKEMEMLGYKTDQGGFDKYREKNAALFGNQIIQFFSDSQGNNPKYKYDENYNISESEFDFMKDTFTFCAKNQNSDSEGGNYSLTQENGNDESSTGSPSQPSTGSSSQQSNGGTQRFNVIGTLKKASNDSEAATAIYVDLDLAKKIINESIRLSNIRNYKLTYSSINVYCNDSKDVAAVKKEIQDKGYSCSTDDEGLQEQKKVMRVVQLILGAIGAVSMFVAAFGISNTMVMSVFERTKEIGIMKVLGCDIKDIKDMFLYEAGIIGLFGGTIGIIISYIISIIANLVAKKVMSGMIDTSMGAKICVSSIPLWLAVLGIAFSVGVGVLAGLIKAKRRRPMSETKNIKKSLAKAIFILYLLLVWLFFIDRGLIIHKLFGAYWQFIRPLGFRSINLSPSFSTMLSEGKDVFVLNLAAFIPMGFFICLFTKGKSKYKHVYLIFAIPVLIELLQYIFATGALDINDIILNVISGIIGVTAYAIIHKIKQR